MKKYTIEQFKNGEVVLAYEGNKDREKLLQVLIAAKPNEEKYIRGTYGFSQEPNNYWCEEDSPVTFCNNRNITPDTGKAYYLPKQDLEDFLPELNKLKNKFKKMYTIKDLSEGKIAIENNVDVNKLQEILKKAFPNQKFTAAGDTIYYYKSEKSNDWEASDYKKCFQKLNLEIVPASEIIMNQRLPQFGEEILAWSSQWMCKKDKDKVIFIGFTDNQRIMVLNRGRRYWKEDLERLRNFPDSSIEIFTYDCWDFIEEEPTVEITLEEIAQLKNCKVEQIRIKE